MFDRVSLRIGSTLRWNIFRHIDGCTAATSYKEHAHFYLQTWANDLKYRCPCLEDRRIDHPCQVFYLMWKLWYCLQEFLGHHGARDVATLLRPATRARASWPWI
jgi:hypothetical protein